MGTEDRVKEILARQAAAAKVEKDSEAEAKILAGQLNELRDAVTQNWPVRRAHIPAFVTQLNSQMRENGHQLFVMESIPSVPIRASKSIKWNLASSKKPAATESFCFRFGLTEKFMYRWALVAWLRQGATNLTCSRRLTNSLRELCSTSWI